MLVAVEFGMTLEIIMEDRGAVLADAELGQERVEHAGDDVLAAEGERGCDAVGFAFAQQGKGIPHEGPGGLGNHRGIKCGIKAP